jgi:hypothetical protein
MSLPAKHKTYKHLYLLNRALNEVMFHCDWLGQVDFISDDCMEACRLTALEIQAVANAELSRNLHAWEFEDVGRHADVLRDWERERKKRPVP